MKKLKYKKWLLLVSGVLLCAIVVFSQLMHIKNYKGVPKQSDLIYVNDFANVLSEDSKEYIVQFNEYLSSKKEKPQIIVTTIESFGSYVSWDYVNKMFDDYGLNEEFRKNDILIIYSKHNNKFYVKSWLSANSSYMSWRFTYLRESSRNLLKEGKVDEAVLNVFKNACNLICYHYDYDVVANDTIGFDYPATMEMMIGVAARQKYKLIFVGSVLFLSFVFVNIDNIRIKKQKKKDMIIDIEKKEEDNYNNN